MTATSTSLTTSLSGGGASGSTISVTPGTSVSDSATLSGANASTAGGSVTYTVYSDDACTTAVGSGGTVTVSSGAVPNSSTVTLTTPGTYYWEASYSGDILNEPSVSPCGSETETVTTAVASTSLSTSLSAGSQSGTSVSVPAGTAVSDSAILSGTNASTAGGTVTYTVYSDDACTTSAGSGGRVTVSDGVVPGSTAVTLTTPGTYYWQASYSGDGVDDPSTSPCGSETETVTTATTVPTCVLTGNIAGPPAQIQVTTQDTGSGLASVVVTSSTNDTVSIPAFTSGTTSPVIVTATKNNQAKVATLALKVTNVDGNSVSCDPADFTVTDGHAQLQSGIPSADHFVTITNRGLRTMWIGVNDHSLSLELRPFETVTLNLGLYFGKSDDNIFAVGGLGPGSANVLVWNGVTGAQTNQPPKAGGDPGGKYYLRGGRTLRHRADRASKLGRGIDRG